MNKQMVVCINNKEVEKQVTVDKIYLIEEEFNEFYSIKNDEGKMGTYFKRRFAIPIDSTKEAKKTEKNHTENKKKMMVCVNNKGLEKYLTIDKIYLVEEEVLNKFYIVTNDLGEETNIFKYRFKPVVNLSQEANNTPVENKSKFEIKAEEIGKLVSKKNKEYGNAIVSVNEILRILYPTGVKPEQYKDLSVLIRVLDKVFRIAHGNQGNENAWNDVCGYGLTMSIEE